LLILFVLLENSYGKKYVGIGGEVLSHVSLGTRCSNGSYLHFLWKVINIKTITKEGSVNSRIMNIGKMLQLFPIVFTLKKSIVNKKGRLFEQIIYAMSFQCK